MMDILLIVSYIIGVLITAYVIGRVDMSELAALAVVWPLLLVVLLIYWPTYGLAQLGQRDYWRKLRTRSL